MNSEPRPTDAFDPSEELLHFGDENQEHYGLPARIFFYLIVTARHIESFAGTFTIDAALDPTTKAPAGCVVEFVVHHGFWIDVSAQRLKLWALEADGTGNRWLVFEADSSNPSAWESLLKKIGNIEGFYVVGAHADKLRLMWTQWLAARERGNDERSF